MSYERYSRTAIFLHWSIALALAFQLALGWRLEDIPEGPGLFAAYQLHKSVGITILLLTIVRLLIRVMRKRPAPIADTIWAQRLTRAVHSLFYGVLLLGPLTGWAIVSTSKIQVPTLLFGIVSWPHLPIGRSWHEPFEGMHNLIAWAGLGLFVLHVAGALRHQFVKDENILGRMIPFITAAPVGKGRAAWGLGLVLFAVWTAHGAGWQIPFSTPAAPENEPSPAITPVRVAPEPAVVPDEPPEAGAVAQPLAEWTVQPGGRLGFSATWAGSPISGHFGLWKSAIRFTPDAPEETTIRISVDLASVNTDDSQRDESLKGPDFFDVETHPKAVFTANGVRPLGRDRFEARGVLDLHGVRQPATLSFTMKIKGDMAQVSGTTKLDRTAFGVGSGEWAATDQIASGVGVTFNFSAKRKVSF
jgi:cytochrome b561/polyisoprenoid-binding protein YceI